MSQIVWNELLSELGCLSLGQVFGEHGVLLCQLLYRPKYILTCLDEFYPAI